LDARSATPAYPDLSGKVRELEANVVSSTQKLAAANGAQTDLQRQLAEANAAAQNAAKTTDDSAKLRRERDEFSNRVTALSGENAELRSDRERMQKLLADSGKQQRDSTADASRIKILESQSAGLQTSLNAALAQVTTLQKSLAGKSDVPAYPDLSGKVRELESRLAATNQQADAAVQTAVATSKQSTADLNAASAQIAQLRADLAAKPAPAPTPDLSGRVRELENQLAAASTENARAKQEIVALGKARDEASKNRGPTYPNLAGRVVELQTALADTKRDLSDAQNALRAAEQARTAAAATAPVAVAAATGPVSATEPSDLQKQLADTESRLATALRGYAILQRDRDAQIDTASKSADAVTTERNALAAQVTTLTAELDQLKAGAANQTGAARAEVTRSSESLAALQRSTSQNAIDLANTRALLKQVQGANTVLANENYQLKSRLSPGSAPVPAANAAIAPVPAPTTTRTHIVATGDTLSRLSQRYYGTPSRWQEIYQANAGKLGTTGVLRIGVELTIP
jgi:chromosome segregation ATPase/phage tail protein X